MSLTDRQIKEIVENIIDVSDNPTRLKKIVNLSNEEIINIELETNRRFIELVNNNLDKFIVTRDGARYHTGIDNYFLSEYAEECLKFIWNEGERKYDLDEEMMVRHANSILNNKESRLYELDKYAMIDCIISMESHIEYLTNAFKRYDNADDILKDMEYMADALAEYYWDIQGWEEDGDSYATVSRAPIDNIEADNLLSELEDL